MGSEDHRHAGPARRGAVAVAQGCGVVALGTLAIIVALALWFVHGWSRAGYPEAHDAAEASMAQSHREVVTCLEGRAGELSGATEARDLTRVTATCFDRPEAHRGDFTLTALVSRHDTVMQVLSHSLRYGSYIIGARADAGEGAIQGLDVGSGSSPEVLFGATANVTLAQCWEAKVALDSGEIGRRERIECDADVVALVYGSRADEGYGLAGE